MTSALLYVTICDMKTSTKEQIMKHSIHILANLNCGDYIVRTSFHGIRRMSRGELAAHEAAGAAITWARQIA